MHINDEPGKTVAQASKSAVSRVSKPADRTTLLELPNWKPAAVGHWPVALPLASPGAPSSSRAARNLPASTLAFFLIL